MTSTAKVVIAIVIILIVIAIGWTLWGNTTSPSTEAVSQSSVVSTPSPTPTPTPTPLLSTASTDTSTSALESDLTTVDGEIRSMDTDSADVDQNVNSSVAPGTVIQ